MAYCSVTYHYDCFLSTMVALFRCYCLDRDVIGFSRTVIVWSTGPIVIVWSLWDCFGATVWSHCDCLGPRSVVDV